jgi:NitT/TauT family transport system substrate-binding protein
MIVPALLLITSAALERAAAGEKVTIRFTWKLKGEYAPLFVAQKKGYFEAEGLEVELAEGAGAQAVLQVVAAGTENIAYGPATAAVQAIGSGMPVVVAALYQTEAPIAIVAFPDVPLASPKDMEGRTIGVSAGDTFSDLLGPFASINNVEFEKIRRVQMDSSARTTQFLNRKIDILPLYLSNELPKLEKVIGQELNVLRVADYGLAVPGAAVIVNKGFAGSNPDTLKRVLRAIDKGYRDSVANPDDAAEIMGTLMLVPEDPEVLTDQVSATVASLNQPEGKPIGWQSEEYWATALSLLKQSGAVTAVGDPGEYYTNAFLE